ncbi:MAG: hypothetical protein WC058_02520 [Phycisphaeraceae bacterium]
MSDSLLELCNLVADEGAKYAHQYKELFSQIVKKATDKTMADEQIDATYKIFSFLNWAYANGVWSNLNIPTLRRDLMEQSMKSIVLRTAYELAEDKSNEGVAFLASELDTEFREFALAYNKRIKELSRQGFEPDANTAMIYGLERIQEDLNLNDDVMNVIVPQFYNRAGNVPRIEEVAIQINRAASQRKRGFFSKLFGL